MRSNTTSFYTVPQPQVENQVLFCPPDISINSGIPASSILGESSSQQSLYNDGTKSLDDIVTCCLAEAVGTNKYVACYRPVSGIPLSEKLREMSTLKGFPFVYNNSRRHYYICLYHRRVIVHEPPLQRNELLEKRDLSIYDSNSSFTDDEKLEMLNDPLLKKKTSLRKTYHSENDENTELDDHQTCSRQSSSEIVPTKCNAKEKVRRVGKEVKNLKSDENTEDNRSEIAMTHELPMKLLSANTLRRYKKAFQLPHRSGTNTKSQLLEGINEHLATLEVPPHETIANFLYQSKMHRNKLDFPSSNDISECVFAHCTS